MNNQLVFNLRIESFNQHASQKVFIGSIDLIWTDQDDKQIEKKSNLFRKFK